LVEAGDDVGGFEGEPSVAADQQPGMVIHGVEDLHLGAVGELPVGDVGLPAFVRKLGHEAGP
jgi:hypothetical protein